MLYALTVELAGVGRIGMRSDGYFELWTGGEIVVRNSGNFDANTQCYRWVPNGS